MSGIQEDDAADSYAWDVSGHANGKYYIQAAIVDGTNPERLNCSSGPVTVDHGDGPPATPWGATRTVTPTALVVRLRRDNLATSPDILRLPLQKARSLRVLYRV